MTRRASSPCRASGCAALVPSTGYCAKHAHLQRKQSDEQRGSSTERGYGYKWQKASKIFLREHPLCQCADCKEGELRLRASQVVDHKIPHRLKEANDSGDPIRIAEALKLMWDRKNWQALNKTCHDKKTRREDGGFGNKRTFIF